MSANTPQFDIDVPFDSSAYEATCLRWNRNRISTSKRRGKNLTQVRGLLLAFNFLVVVGLGVALEEIKQGPEDCFESWTPEDCFESWIPWRNSCYFVSKTEGTFETAKDDCLSRGARLAFPSADEYVFLKAFVPGSSRKDFQAHWLDITLKNGAWRNGLDQDVTNILQSYWAYDQPNGGQDCGVLYQEFNSTWMSLGLHDLSCTSSYPTWTCFRDK